MRHAQNVIGMIESLSFTNFLRHPRFWRHAGPWILVMGFVAISLLVESGASDNPMQIDAMAFFGILDIIVMIYASFYLYNTLYKKKGKKKLFFVLIAILIIGMSCIDGLINTRVIRLGAVEGFFANILFFPLIVFVAFGLKLGYHGARQLFVIEKLQAQQMESELKLLKSQVNPHFLFNTLNNIYSTNLEDHNKANEIILELSDLLRYQLESYKTKFTPLDKEIKSIENYIDLERIRVLDCTINITKEGNFEEVEILPLLLLPFVENAFKYGTGIEPGVIDVQMRLSEKKQFLFIIKNKIVQKKGKVHSGGIGLENVKKRLALMYTDKHELDIIEKDAHFTVNLTMQL